MSSSYSIRDYKSTHFEYSELEKIHGHPDIDSLLRIFRQLKRNAQRVPTILGGGQLGYLALVISTASYNAITNSQPFYRPLLPGSFTPSGVRVSAAELSQEKSAHDEMVRTYNECQAVEQALRNQLIDAIPPAYLDSLRNVDSDMINDSIPTIIAFLTENYCQMTDQELSDREDELKRTTFNPEEPVDLIFNRIKEFSELCAMTGNDKSDRQLVAMGYLIFNRTKAYTDALKTWNAKPLVEKTFANLKIHLRTEYHALRRVGALTVHESSLNANMLRDITEHQNMLSSNLGEQLGATLQANFTQALSVLRQNTDHTDDDDENVDPRHKQMNNQSSDKQEMMKMIQQMQTKMDALTTQLSNTSATTDASGLQTQRGLQTQGQTKKLFLVNPITGREYKRYCWSCGCCTHWGANCPQKKAGHKDDASFKQRKGGSNVNCLGPPK